MRARPCSTPCAEPRLHSCPPPLYPQVLADLIPEERTLKSEAGFAWGAVAELVAVYKDLGLSRGMELGIETARARGLPIEFRSLAG